MNFSKLSKLNSGDKVGIVSPSFAAPGKWPHVYELALKRVREVFELEPVEFSVTSKLGASKEERSKDLIDSFIQNDIKAVIASLGGDDQITYIKNLPSEPFIKNPKPFSDLVIILILQIFFGSMEFLRSMEHLCLLNLACKRGWMNTL